MLRALGTVFSVCMLSFAAGCGIDDPAASEVGDTSGGEQELKIGTISVSPNPLPAFAPLTVTGKGFSRNTPIMAGYASDPWSDFCRSTTDATGAFSCTITRVHSPDNYGRLARYTVYATLVAAGSNRSASASVDMIGSVTVPSERIPVGGTFTVSGEDIAPNTDVSAWARTFRGEYISSSKVRTDSSGRFTTTLTAPRVDLTYVSVCAPGACTEYDFIHVGPKLEVSPELQPIPNSTSQPYGMVPLGPVTISSTEFPPNLGVTVEFLQWPLRTPVLQLSATTDGQGAFSVTTSIATSAYYQVFVRSAAAPTDPTLAFTHLAIGLD